MTKYSRLVKKLEVSIASALYDDKYESLTIPQKADVDRFIEVYIVPDVDGYISRNYDRKAVTEPNEVA